MSGFDNLADHYKKNFEDLNLYRYGNLNKNRKFYFYYDESDNIRSFNLKKGKYNENYLSQFTLGGIMSEVELSNEMFDDLFSKLDLQKSVKELKSKYLFNNSDNLIEKFNSKKLKIFLEYIYEKEYYLHFNTMNVFYYGVVVDIIDSLIEKNNLIFSKYGLDFQFSENLKSYLYQVMIIKANEWGEFLSDIMFPNLSIENKGKFLYKLYNEIYANNIIEFKTEKNIILELIEKFPDNKNLIFLSNEKDYILIDSFKEMYYHKIIIYDNSFHVIDEEDIIQKKFEILEIDKSRYSNIYEFKKSNKIRAIQVSDVCVAIISNLYKILSTENIKSLKKILDEENSKTLVYVNFKLLSKIIKKSIDYDHYLILQMNNGIELEKYKLFINYFNNR